MKFHELLKLGLACLFFFTPDVRGQAVDLTNGLVACYSFSGNANDGSGNNNNGTANGPVLVDDRFGTAQSAYQFNGFSNFISVPSNAFRNNNYSYAAWVNPSVIPQLGDVGNIISIGDGGGQHQALNLANVYATSGYVGWNAGGFNNGFPGTTSATSGIIPTVNQWYHLVSTRDDNFIKLYLNGVLVASAGTNGTTPYYGSPTFLNIGARSSGGQQFNGTIDDVAFYSRALSDQEVLKLYTVGVPCATNVVALVNDSFRCGGGKVTITAGGGTHYEWYDASSGGNLLFVGNPFETPFLSASQDYYVVASVGAIQSVRKKITVTIFPALTIRADFPATVYANENNVYTVDVLEGSPISYHWNFGNGDVTTSVGSQQTYKYFLANNFQVKVNAIDNHGCLAFDSSMVEVKFRDNPPPVDLQAGLIACYSFSGNANDGTGNNNNGVVNGSVLTADRFGRTQSAYAFNGGSNYIAIPANSFKNNNYSYVAWVRPSAIPGIGDVGNIISIGDGDGSGWHQTLNLANVYATAGYVGWNAGGYNNGSPLTTSAQSGINPVVNQWVHLVSTRNNSSIKLYVNGVLIATGATNGTTPYYGISTNANIGARSNYSQPFQGVIDDVLIYRRALSDQEVLSLYHGDIPCGPVVIDLQTKDASACGKASFSLLASGAESYRWYDQPVNGNLLSIENPFVTPVLTASTTYYVSGISSQTTSALKEVRVTLFPLPELSCNFPGKVNLGESVDFQTEVSFGSQPLTYLWDLGDTVQIITHANSISHTYRSDNDYPVTVTVVDGNGCSTSCTTGVEVDYNPFIPNVITDDYDDLNSMLTLYTKTKSGYIKNAGDKPYVMRVYDRWGKEVYSTQNVVNGWRAEDVAVGVYYYRIQRGTDIFKGWVDVLR
jgi:Concanavalin A-like lectin/glucanases superfamily/Ig-like domain CHU_C associated/PKD domain/CHU_C Type IX secretion signal domain